LFGAKQQEINTNKQEPTYIKSLVLNQICTLRNAYLTVDGWKQIIDDFDNTNLCTHYDIFHIQLKAKYLSVTLTQALSFYQTSTFLNICTSAIDRIDEVDYDSCDTESTGRIRNPKTIMQWYRTFCDNNHFFPNPAI
jgi:hypothetical protein